MKFAIITRRAASAFAAIALAVSSCLAGLSGQALAAGGTMYLQPGTIMATGSDFTVQIRVNTGGQNVNAVESDLTYPTGQLTFVSINAAWSAFDVDASSTGGSGSVSVTRGSTVPHSGDLLVATLLFHVVGTGAVNLVFQNSSALVESAGSTDILTTKTNGSYTSIAGPLIPVYRLANWMTHERLFTIDSNERDNAVAHIPGWVSEGVSFDVVPSGTADSSPVYRLANWMTHERLFTVDSNERDNAVAHIPGWVSEGTSFNVVPSTTAGSIPVYRLANWMTHERLFTVDSNERDNAVAHIPGWVSEGVAFNTAP